MLKINNPFALPKEAYRFTTRKVVTLGLMIALSVVLSTFDIWITPSFKLFSLLYLPGVIVSVLYGPIIGMAFGFISDFATYIIKPMGPYFMGYALSAMVANLIYGIFIYNRKISLIRVVIARALVVLIVTLGLNAIWMQMMYGQTAGQFYTGTRLIRNLIQFPIDVLLIMYISRLAVKIENTSFHS